MEESVVAAALGEETDKARHGCHRRGGAPQGRACREREGSGCRRWGGGRGKRVKASKCRRSRTLVVIVVEGVSWWGCWAG